MPRKSATFRTGWPCSPQAAGTSRALKQFLCSVYVSPQLIEDRARWRWAAELFLSFSAAIR